MNKRHLTRDEICRIEAYSDLKVSQAEIAHRLKCAKPTISEDGIYKAEIAQKRKAKS